MSNVITPDLVTMRKKLETISASGAIEDNNPVRIRRGFQMFEDFRANRKLRYYGYADPIVPWLHGKNSRTKFYDDHDGLRPPFEDHCRDFVDLATKQRIATIQPYFLAVAGKTKTPVPSEFIQHLNDGFERTTRRGTFIPLPQLPVIQDTIAAVVAAAQRASDEFANKYGLKAKVSFDFGWYCPERVILIEYTKEVAA